MLLFAEPQLGLRAVVVLDDLTLGPAAGGIRTKSYADEPSAVVEASRLARSMTRKCALAGLDAGGGKGVMMMRPELDRTAAFARLGEFIEELGGIFRTAGDLGTTAADLEAMATRTRYVETDGRGLAEAVARGVEVCMSAALAVGNLPQLSRSSVLIQGVGSMGAAVARRLAPLGAELILSDLDLERAQALARELGARVVSVDRALVESVDVFCPCADGGVLTESVASATKAKLICGAANDTLASPDIPELLRQRGVIHVPDAISSAGAVIAGIGKSVMGLVDTGPLIDGLGRVTSEVLEESFGVEAPPEWVARTRAAERISVVRAARSAAASRDAIEARD